jgi:RNA polymerase sigma-70 factor, ECF subfamily
VADGRASMLQPSEIEAVLDRVSRGDRDAYGQIVRSYSLPLRSYLAAQVYHLDDVDDLAQEVFIAAYRNLSTFRRGEDFGAWLRGIARNKLHVYIRSSARRDRALRQFREDVLTLVGPDLDRAAASDTSGAIEALLRCIAQLPEKMRRVVRAGLEGEKSKALAEELLTTVGAIYNLQYRANQLLRDCLQRRSS